VKKLLTAFIAVCYLVFASGFVVNVHYCMGKVDKISIGPVHSDACGNCGMQTSKSNGCCTDHTSIYKINDNHTLNDFDSFFKAPGFSPIVHFGFIAEIIPPDTYTSTHFINSSPPGTGIKRSILFSNFRV
jgi:hypothetical protein